ncbi:MAG: ATPase [Elusimicrobia bacterium RIFOXYD2_FULL_34_15]|nr:MAG: ATPase [Elusimicrobia bacterium RIFOXYD2_FULL_34_15]HAM38319.1 ATPase [Elusimicrobiota bacterium]
MNNKLLKNAILRIGEVSGIEGRKVFIKVDKNKNSSDILFDGNVIKNIAVGSYVEIKKGFLSIIGKVDSEKLTEEVVFNKNKENDYTNINKNNRILTLGLVGYIGINGKFIGGIKELPLIGNEAFILSEQKIHCIHNLRKDNSSLSINVAKTDTEEIPIDLPIDGLFNSHIAIVGNTGSGKSNTLAALFQGLFDIYGNNKGFLENSQFLIFDFNGEYTKEECITKNKKIYNLKTQVDSGDKIPLHTDELFDSETLSILVEATDKTQKPFLKRALRFYKTSKKKENFPSYLRTIIQNKIKTILKMANKDIAYKLLDYLEEILEKFIYEDAIIKNLTSDIEFHSKCETFKILNQEIYFNKSPVEIENTSLYKAASSIDDATINKMTDLSQFYIFLHLQLIEDLFRYKVQNEHIYPVINRFKAKQESIDRTFESHENHVFWGNYNCVVVNLDDVNLDMKKTIPLLLAKNIYNAHKKKNNKKSLNIIIDEAHNILSKTSFRETDDWKDYRLETFEEIIKEGRKFGVFITIASQRPNDISETIISQAHNYFVHQLINQRDLLAIGNAVSYIDKITEESIPTLPVGTCIFSGTATSMPLKLKITELPINKKPDSLTLEFKNILNNI